MTAADLFFAAATGIGLGILVGRRAPRVWLAATLAGLTMALLAAVTVLLGGADWDWHSRFLVGGEPLHLRLDGLSAFFLVLLCVVGGAGAVYAREYWPDAAHPRSARTGRVWWSVMLFSLGFVLLAANGLHFLIAWELFTRQRLFSDHRWTASAGKCGRRAGFIWRLRMRPRSACSPSSPCWRRAPAVGNSDPCAITRNWRRCSGWRSSASA